MNFDEFLNFVSREKYEFLSKIRSNARQTMIEGLLKKATIDNGQYLDRSILAQIGEPIIQLKPSEGDRIPFEGKEIKCECLGGTRF